MSTKKQLIDRWKVAPWIEVDKKIYDFFMYQTDKPSNQEYRSIQPIVDLLEGLPYRDEVASGIDLRGSSFLGGRFMDLQSADCSYCKIGSLSFCNLNGAIFSSNMGGSLYEIKGNIANASFKSMNLKKTWLDRSVFENCDFSASNLTSAILKCSIFKNCNFQGSNCESTDLQKSDLRGSDFTNANLSNALFREVILDKTTILNGAKLFDLICEDQYDFSGKLVIKGSDWRQATYNESTLVGKDSTSIDRALLRQIAFEAKKMNTGWANSVADEAKRYISVLKNDPSFDWYTALKKFASEQANELEELIQKASMDI